MTITTVQKVGNGYYINIGIAYANRLNLNKGSHVTVELTDKGLLIRPLKINTKEAQSGYENKTPKTS